VVDAGNVRVVDSPALAVLFAARAWAEEHNRRFLLSRTSPAFDAALAEHGVADDLPRLVPLPAARREVVLPQPRVSVD
jgi:anti-anti-sigma regulatory factor